MYPYSAMYDADRLPANSMAGTLYGLGMAGHKVVLLESLETYVSTDCFVSDEDLRSVSSPSEGEGKGPKKIHFCASLQSSQL